MQPVIIIGIYFFIILLVGFLSYFSIKTPADYYIAGKRAGLLPVSGSLLATILGGSAILGTIELSMKTGWPALWFLFCAAFGLFLLVPLAKQVQRLGRFTLPELLGLFYGRKAQLTASVIIPVAWLGIIAAQVIAAAKILSGLEIISYSNAALLSGTVFILYTLAGGQVSILKTDTLQAVLIITGLLSLTLISVNKTGFATVESFRIQSLFNSSFSFLDLIILVLTYSVTFVVGPDIYSRIFCAKNEKTATRSIIIVALILIPVSFILTYLGIISGKTDGAGIISFAQHLMPGWFYGLFLAALLSAVMSSADTTLLTSSLILCELVTGNPDNKKSMLLTRLFVVITGLVSISIALFVTSILQSLLLALTFFSGAFVVPTLAGLLRLKVIKNQVFPAMLTGGIVALSGKILNYFFDPLTGNIIIIFSFILNAFLLFIALGRQNQQTTPEA